MADSAKIVHSASTQARSQISSLYDMSINLAQNTCVHTNLQDGVLSTYGKSNDYQVLNRNFLKPQALVNSDTLFDELMDVRFYLPTDLAVPNGSTLMYPDKIEQEAWYAEYLVGGNILRWYLADRVQGSGAQDVLCAVRPIQALSRFYKITLNHGSDFIRVADEVEHIRDCFILQPLVENSVLHDIREKDSQSSSSSVGYGLSNIQQRIHLYCGKRFGLSIDSTPGKGTTVRVTMPCIRQEPQHREL